MSVRTQPTCHTNSPVNCIDPFPPFVARQIMHPLSNDVVLQVFNSKAICTIIKLFDKMRLLKFDCAFGLLYHVQEFVYSTKLLSKFALVIRLSGSQNARTSVIRMFCCGNLI